MARSAPLLVLASLLAAGCYGVYDREADDEPWLPPWQRPVESPRRWTSIVVHHTGEPRHDPEATGDAPWHFVIGNGLGLGVGEVEVADRWLAQGPGEDAGIEGAIEVALAGDLDETDVPLYQMTALVRLCLYFAKAHGIPDEAIRLHRDLPGASTTCPGSRFEVEYFRAILRESRRED